MPKPNVREQIVSAGLDTLHRCGFNGCGVEEITQAAKVPKGSFYNHFESKEALGVAAVERYWEMTQRGLAVLQDEHLAPLQRLRRYFGSLADLMHRWKYAKGCLVGNFSAELADQSPSVRDRVSAVLAAWTRALEECIRAAQADGAVDPNFDAGALAAFLLNAWEGAVLRSKVDKDGTAQRQFLAIVFSKLLVPGKPLKRKR